MSLVFVDSSFVKYVVVERSSEVRIWFSSTSFEFESEFEDDA